MTDAATSGKELIEATQEAVIEAVSDVENILQTTSAEIVHGHHEVFYQSAEFWVGVAFILVVSALFLPVSKVLCSMLEKKISGIEGQIKEAADLRDEARLVLADYEQRMENIQERSDDIVKKAHKDAAAFRGRELRKLEKDLAAQEKSADEVINAHKERIVSEATTLVAESAVKLLRQAVKNNLNAEMQAKLIDESIKTISQLK